MDYQPIIGMEIHIELKTNSKMFCGCKNDPFNAPKPNIYTCPVCLGLPGALPVANKKAIEWTIMLGLALGCRINQFSKFDRKHYFYPDLPKGYQISQHDLPFCFDGKVLTSEGEIRIRRIHLEEDTGKLVHATAGGKKVSLIDFNRSGVPLVEIVTEPDIQSASQAKEYAKKIYQIVRYLGISEADMEKGQMRLEANVSLKNQKDKDLPNYKVELKNINSFRFLEKAIEYEIARQKKIISDGKTPLQETRGYNAQKNITYSQRSKEEAADYRYFPDPDIPPIKISDDWLGEIKTNLPQLPEQILKTWQEKYQLKNKDLDLLFDKPEETQWLDLLFQEANKQGIDLKKLANYLINKKLPVNLYVDQVEKVINVFKNQTAVADISEDKLKEVVKKVLSANPKPVEDLKKGKANALNFLIGQVMRELRQKVDFERLRRVILECV